VISLKTVNDILAKINQVFSEYILCKLQTYIWPKYIVSLITEATCKLDDIMHAFNSSARVSQWLTIIYD